MSRFISTLASGKIAAFLLVSVAEQVDLSLTGSIIYGPRREKTVFGVSGKTGFKPVSSATENS